VISELRPSELEDQGLVNALAEYLKSWSQISSIPARLHVQTEHRLALPQEQVLYRVAQEALSNAARHSHASEVVVRLEYGADSVQLEVSDNGQGFHPQARQEIGLGLQSMHERAAAVGGKLFIESRPGQGASVRLVAPIAKMEAD
jgi:signal transduction histidine kinase